MIVMLFISIRGRARVSKEERSMFSYYIYATSNISRSPSLDRDRSGMLRSEEDCCASMCDPALINPTNPSPWFGTVDALPDLILATGTDQRTRE